MSFAVEVDECSVRLGRHDVLDRAMLVARSGEIVGVEGENGSGKSTLLRLVAGLVRPVEGSVRVWGQKPTDPVVRSRVGAAIDTPAFYSWMSGLGCLKTIMDMSGEADRGRCRAVLEDFGLHTAGRRRVFQYSQGMKKRLALAAAAVNDPDLLLLDEPTNALDTKGQDMAYRWLDAERSRGCCIILVTHRPEDREICDQLYRLRDGQLSGHRARPRPTGQA